MRSVIFDLDGTLADTSGDLLAAANHCFRKLGHGDVLQHGLDSGVALRGGKMMLTTGLKRLGVYQPETVEEFYPLPTLQRPAHNLPGWQVNAQCTIVGLRRSPR